MKRLLLIVLPLLLIVGCSQKPVDKTTLIEKDGVMYLPNSDKPYTGKVNSFYESGETKEEGDYNMAPPKKTEASGSVGWTTKKGTKFRVTHSQSKAEGNTYYPKRKDTSTILSIGKSFKKGGAIKKAYLGSYIAGGPNKQSNATYRKYYKGLV